MRITLKRAFLTLAVALVCSLAFGQVTTSSTSGRVVDDKNAPLPGATVQLTHEPSGTQYGTVTDAKGTFRIPNMRVGGPYKAEIRMIGFQTAVYSDIVLQLGQNYVLNSSLKEATLELKEVVIQAGRNPILNSQRTGAATAVSNREITTLPSISRSVNDFTRLVPQANGNSFAGRDGRYNTIKIDGADFNNSFGLSSKNLPGGDAQPISLDAIEEVSVNIAPYDVRQSNFTGASINAVTRSGDNEYKGSAYLYYRDKSFNGKHVGDYTLNLTKSTTTTTGARVGGPIVKNKLFFFVNAENEKSSFPGTIWRPSSSTLAADPAKYISRTTEEDLDIMRNYLIGTHGYNPGSYKNFDNFESKNNKFLVRLDWNINKSHKFTVRFNTVKSTNDQEVNATSAPNPRSTYGRISEKSMAFTGANYNFENTVNSLSAELNSVFGSKMANKFIVTYTKIRDKRDSDSDIFPFVDIYKEGTPYMSFGYELFTYDNDVKNNVFTLADNFNFYLGKHTLTAGFSYDYLYFGNSYKRYGTSYYRYASMDDFMTNKAPTAFGLTYPYEGAGDGYAELKFGYGSVYLQDEIQVLDNLKITAGLRVERPFYLKDPLPNSAIAALNFGGQKIDVGQWPEAKIQWSPRIGFNYDVLSDRTVQVRGGTGLFTGRLPFVWFTNQPTNSGTLQNTVEITDAATLATLLFNKDPFYYKSKFPSSPSTTAPGSMAVVSPDFKMPQVWRSNLATDIKIPFQDFVFTGEFIYTKDVNAVVQYNVNQKAYSGNLVGPDQRPIFPKAATNADKRYVSSVSTAMQLENASKGYSYSLTAMLTKPYSNGLSGSIAYTYSMAKDLSANPGSTASSAWQSNPAVYGQNNPGLSYSQFTVPHRVVGSISYRIEYLRHLATTVSLLYEGSSMGRLSYIYSTDINNDGNTADLMYIPKDATEITFTDIKSNGAVLFTAAQQNDAFWKFVNQDDYLKNHKGQYAERYGAVMPWYNRFDFKLLQDVFTNIGKRRHSLQVSLDLLNVGNLINKDWGVRQTQSIGSYDFTLLKSTVGTDNKPTFQMNTITVDGKPQLPTSTYKDVRSTSSTWGALIGVRYTF
ncbi:TonB-dependent receptor [Acetobacteroides hydrogenigenes]|uniref:Carboxypeptidase family protein n=1 Tax=Acetobacteroides hydrogenigenes TaxID=979970 RepID=A0A4R2E644_9BACT|nr:carboxypeptidase regulatory-like domain-containing protein [Acetobacteroides hydrogenigenes]TCN63918.1 carboxypeptidase family protein [Acetobacteroides hydrogenigenes]